jgi:hypothetical protein
MFHYGRFEQPTGGFNTGACLGNLNLLSWRFHYWRLHSCHESTLSHVQNSHRAGTCGSFKLGFRV